MFNNMNKSILFKFHYYQTIGLHLCFIQTDRAAGEYLGE